MKFDSTTIKMSFLNLYCRLTAKIALKFCTTFINMISEKKCKTKVLLIYNDGLVSTQIDTLL